MALADLRARVPVAEQVTARVDVGEYLQPPAEPGQEVLVYREPRIDQIYQAAQDVPRLRKRHPLWHEDKLFGTLLLAQCHAEPAPADRPDLMAFYEHVAESNDRLYVYLLRRVHGAFPWIRDLLGAAEEKKGGSEE